MSSSAQPEPENKCPDCLYMELTANPIYSRRLPIFKRVLKNIELYLTLSFNEEQIEWEDGSSINFGIKAGSLRLNLENGKIPYKDRQWNNTFTRLVPIERQTKVAEKKKTSGKASVSIEGDIKAESTGGSENTAETTDKLQFSAAQITTKGSPQTPAWAFQEQTGEQFLKGDISNQRLATVTVKEKPCKIEATFEISKRNVYICDYEGFWLLSLFSEKQKLKILKTRVYKYLQAESSPYLSRQELKYE